MATGPGVTLLEWPEATALGAAVGVTMRRGGASTGPYDSLNLGLHVGDDAALVVTNRQRAAMAFGGELSSLVFAEQVHGTGVGVVGPSDRGRGTRSLAGAVPSSDVLVTTDVGTVLVMLVADCVPLALVDPEARVLAVVHAGWRGTAAGVVGRAVETMAGLGARADRLMAYMGPAVHPDRYQVDAAVLSGLARAVEPDELWPEVARADGPGHWRVDLIAANRQQLVGAGIPDGQIFESGRSSGDGDFFSDRAARPCGRFALMARLER
jgi:polyphenol oxidase